MVPIRKEGSPYIIAVAVVATLTSLISVIYPFTALRISALVCWVAFIFCVNFFRDPERETPVDESNIISPADGTIIDIRRVTEKGYFKREVNRISIFMSVFNVHVNRAPIEGKIDYLHYRKGDFLAAYREEASSGNEQMSVGFSKRSENGGGDNHELKIMIKLIAGYLARRIVVWKSLDEHVQQGERIGMIKFGSRVEVYLPEEWEVGVKKGDRVKAGETIVGKWVKRNT
jgi:phosphatidylserine decarboxylase